MDIQHPLLKTFFVSALLLFFACEDPSSVGLGLVGDEDGGIPITQNVELTDFTTNAPDDNLVDNTGQLLAGVVDDPTFGRIEAQGFIDFRSVSTQPQSFKDGTVERATLLLIPTYVYGDTLEPITFALHEVTDEFTLAENDPNNPPGIGEELLQFNFTPTQDTVEVTLPLPWATQYDADLRADSFDVAFPGFRLSSVTGNAIVGFRNLVVSTESSTGISALRAFTATDTVSYTANKSITLINQTPGAGPPPDRVVMQKVFTPGLTLNYNLDSLREASLNRAVLRLNLDNTNLETPVNFVRPPVGTLLLNGVVKHDTVSVTLAEGELTDDNYYTFVFNTNLRVFTSPEHIITYPQYFDLNYHGVVQGILRGQENPFLRYEIIYPGSITGNTISPLLLHDITSVSDAPSVLFTTTSR